MNFRKLTRMVLSALFIVVALTAVSCDERNPPDLPKVIYSLKKNIVTPGVALYVDAKEDMLAVAASSAGTYVYDVSDVISPVEVFHYEQESPLYSIAAAIDAVNGLVVTASNGSIGGDRFPIHIYATGQRIGGAAISLPIEDFEIVSIVNSMTVWRTDATDGFAEDSYCYIPDSGRWRPDYCTEFLSGYPVVEGVLFRGFGATGSLFALAQSNYYVRLFDVLTNVTESLIATPGDPQDCAWYGDYLLIADKVHFTVVNIANIDSPEVVTTLTIPGADRLVRIVMDDQYAILMDDSDGLYVVDVSEPSSPTFVQSFSLPEVSGVTATNGKIIASDEQLGVLIYQR